MAVVPITDAPSQCRSCASFGTREQHKVIPMGTQGPSEETRMKKSSLGLGSLDSIHVSQQDRKHQDSKDLDLMNEGGIKQASNSCPDPGEPEHGKRIGSDFSLGATAQFTCDEDYVLQGSKSITCQRVAEVFAAWSDHRPVCKGAPIVGVAEERPTQASEQLQCPLAVFPDFNRAVSNSISHEALRESEVQGGCH
ncbi:CSMD3 protein, partial [Polypterus senegalus]